MERNTQINFSIDLEMSEGSLNFQGRQTAEESRRVLLRERYIVKSVHLQGRALLHGRLTWKAANLKTDVVTAIIAGCDPYPEKDGYVR
jgi:hypothetical protein